MPSPSVIVKMSEDVKTIDAFTAPYGQAIELHEVDFEGGTKLLRLRIREGKRFTVFDIDPATAAHWGTALKTWADSQETE
jgi:hypothetical protein